MVFVKQFGVKLDAVNTPSFLLHRLDRARFVGSSAAKAVRQLLHLVAVRMPNSDGGRQIFEQTLTSVLNRKEPALALRAFVTFAGLEPFHQPDLRTVSERDLLVPTADAQNRLARPLDHVKHSRQRLRRVLVPRMALSTQNDVRRLETADSLQRDAVKRFGEDLQTRNQTSEHRANLSRAGALAVNRVVDEVNEQSYFRL
jgi:hypothetical protein